MESLQLHWPMIIAYNAIGVIQGIVLGLFIWRVLMWHSKNSYYDCMTRARMVSLIVAGSMFFTIWRGCNVIGDETSTTGDRIQLLTGAIPFLGTAIMILQTMKWCAIRERRRYLAALSGH